MKYFALMIALVQGLALVGVLAIIQAIVQAFAPTWHLPFSVWWGMLLCLPGLAMAAMMHRHIR